jgi:hypothetical protein
MSICGLADTQPVPNTHSFLYPQSEDDGPLAVTKRRASRLAKATPAVGKYFGRAEAVDIHRIRS